MPWSGQSGGGGPWGTGPSNGANQPPDLEDILKKSQDRLKQVMPGGNGIGGSFFFLLMLMALGVAAFFGFTVQVEPDELGIVTRFGKYHRQLPPGLNFRYPYPVEQVFLPRVNFTNWTQVGSPSLSDSRPFLSSSSSARNIPEESLMLTGEGDIVKVQFSIQWRIKNAAHFLFNVEAPALTVKEVAEASMREIVGRNKLDFILTEGFKTNQDSVKILMQNILDSYGAGIDIISVLLNRADAPDQVIDAFNDVEAAKQDRQRLANEAEAYQERVTPEAKGEAVQITQAANAYKEQVVAEARGQASRFLSVYNQYKLAPDVTRKRIFLETLEQVYKDTDKIILDNAKGGQGVVPYLPLNELNKKQSQERGQ